MSLEPILESTECWCRSNVGRQTVPHRRRSHGYGASASRGVSGTKILLGDSGTQVYVACPRPLRNGAEIRLEPATYKSQVRRPTNSATTPPI